MSKITRAVFAAMSLFVLVAFFEFDAAPAGSLSLLATPAARTLILGLLFVGAVGACVDLHDLVQKLVDLGEQHTFFASELTQLKRAGFLSVSSAYALTSTAISLVRDMVKVGLFTFTCPEALFYLGGGLLLCIGISSGVFLLGSRSTELENRLRKEANQSWQAMR